MQVLIQETGERRIAALGAVHESYDCHKMPGWDSETVGYHIDEGKIFETDFHELGREVEGMGYFDGRCTISATRICWRLETQSKSYRPSEGDLATVGFCFSKEKYSEILVCKCYRDHFKIVIDSSRRLF